MLFKANLVHELWFIYFYHYAILGHLEYTVFFYDHTLNHQISVLGQVFLVHNVRQLPSSHHVNPLTSSSSSLIQKILLISNQDFFIKISIAKWSKWTLIHTNTTQSFNFIWADWYEFLDLQKFLLNNKLKQLSLKIKNLIYFWCWCIIVQCYE